MNTNRFEVFNKETLPSGSLRELEEVPTVSLRAGGIIAFNNAAAKLLKLRDGMLVGFNRDPDHKDWYIKLNDPKGFHIRITNRTRKKTSETARFSMGHRELSEKIRTDFGAAGLVVIPIEHTSIADMYQLNSRQQIKRAPRNTTPRAKKKK